MRTPRALFVGCFSAVLSLCAQAWGQPPVCPAPQADAMYHSICRPGLRFPVAKFLKDVSVDHSFKDDFVRRIPALIAAFDIERVLEPDHPVHAHAVGASLHFTKTDRATGLVRLGVGRKGESLSTEVQSHDTRFSLTWRLPPKVEGGYWRTPSALQIAFWQDRRPTVSLAPVGGTPLQATIECLALSTDSLRIVTEGTAVPDILVRYDDCR